MEAPEGQPSWPRGIAGRVLLVALTLWALATIVPDFYRAVDPLAAFGLSVDNDGVVIDTIAPFASEAELPAARADIVPGDRVDLRAMRCIPLDAPLCDDTLVLFGGLAGLHHVMPGSRLDVVILPLAGGEPSTFRLEAARPPWNGLDSLVLLLDTVVGIAVVLTAFQLTWRRPCAMTWGFFLFAIWFNPGQTYAFYALITPWPYAILAEEVVEAAAQAAGYVGLVVFALRFPHDVIEPDWRPVQRALPAVAAGMFLLHLITFANAFGFPTETLTRVAYFAGLVLNALVLFILVRRRRHLSPPDDQRMRWVIAGCAIGLPGFIIAELAQSAGLFDNLWGTSGPPQAAVGLLYLLYGVLAWFVSEAIRRPRVISVTVPLRHGTVLTALTLVIAVPVFLLHEWLNHHKNVVPLPEWAWIVVFGPLLALVMHYLHENAVHLADHAFSRRYHRAQHCLKHTGEALRQAKSPDEVDHHLVEGPHQILGVASGAVFRREAETFRRRPGCVGWDDTMEAELNEAEHATLVGTVPKGTAIRLAREEWERRGLPGGVARPCLAVPVSGVENQAIAVAVYGAHHSGSDLDADERAMLAALADHAGAAYERVETEFLRRELAQLRQQLTALRQRTEA